MTPAQALDYLRRRHNESSSTNSYWSDDEIYSLITAREHEACAILGLIEATDTSTTTVASTQAYSWPSDAVDLKTVFYDGTLLSELSFREWENEKQAGGTTPTGTPEGFVSWNRQVLLVPTPNAAKTLTFYYEKLPSTVSAAGTIDLPTVLHYPLMDGVLALMYAKAQNSSLMTHYENLWQKHMIQTFPVYKLREKQRGRARVLIDSDTSPGTSHGVK